MVQFKKGVNAIAIILFALTVVFGSSVTLDRISLLKLYRDRFAFEPGPWFAEHLASISALLASTGYLSHLQLRDLRQLSDHSSLGTEKALVFRSIALPLGKHAQRLNKLVRYWIWLLQAKLRAAPFELRSYENFPGELIAPGDSFYSPGVNFLVDQPGLISQRFENVYAKYRFDVGAAERSFRRALEVFKSHADKVVVVVMPDTSLMNELNREGSPSFDRVLSGSSVAIIDCSKLFSNNESFLDESHLSPSGRQELSQSIRFALGELAPKSLGSPEPARSRDVARGACERAR